jgi:hypothetical protein
MPFSRSARFLSHIGPLRRLPVAQLLVVAELIIVARDHVRMLEPRERRRLFELVRVGRGRRRNLTPREREELADLVAKARPRQFAGTVANRLSPVPLPSRLVRGKRR